MYEYCGRGRLVQVDSANLLWLQLENRNEAINVRLLGVGSPHNRDRVKDLSPAVVRGVYANQIWRQACYFVESLLKGRTVEIWTRRNSPLDQKRRLLAYLVIRCEQHPPVDVNAELIAQGLGFVTSDYLHPTYESYRQLEDEARRAGRGIWRAEVGARKWGAPN
jgi:endonuclease YncB( thermonuclease family)